MDFLKNTIKIFSDVPAWVMGLHLGEVADVADVIALAILVHVLPLHRLA